MTDTGCPEPGTQAPADRGIDWTGERCVPWTGDLQVIYEHYHRYALAARFVAGARVLDLGCGEGFGPALLAGVAREVIGVDIDQPTVEHAGTHYPRENLSFSVGSMVDPELLPDAEPFDVITCFEALEHVVAQDVLITLVRRLLTPGGLFLTSTPDVTVYTHEHGNENPFHVRELSEPEFRELLGGAFGHVALLRQNVAVGSLITAEAPEQGQLLPYVGESLRRAPHGGWQISAELPHTYLLGMASDAPLPALAGLSALIDPELTLVREAQRALGHERHRADRTEEALVDERDRAAADQASAIRRLERLGGEVHQLRTDLSEVQRRAERAESRAAWQEEIAGAAERRAAELEAEVQQLRAEQSALAQRLVSRYRGVIERAAPRGTARRDVYERAMGRRPGAHRAVAAGVAQVRTSSTPVVSIIVPVHGKWDYTHRCLTSIDSCRGTIPFEVLVVDDASPDRTAELAGASPGVRLVRTERNLGFVGACNLGAAAARGSYLLFLNNDTEVQPGWLDALVGTIEADETIGLVGAQLIYPDGRLQESGGIIWADGTGWNYGRGKDAAAAQYQVRRDVDYCSGAAILVRRQLFEQVGGFDERFAPAYYEDTDLAFAIRDAGQRTVVEPRAVVMHHEGVSHGTDPAGGVKRHQEINRAQFVEKWKQALADQLPAASDTNLWLGRHRGPAGHRGGLILVADHQVPTPDRDSGSLRMHRLLVELAGLGERVVFFPANGAALQPYTRALQNLGITVLPDQAGQETFLREAGDGLTLALLSRPHVAWPLLQELRMRAPRCLVLYDTVDLHFLRLQRQADVAASGADSDETPRLAGSAAASKELELGLIRASDITLVVSDYERRLLHDLVPEADVRVLSNIHHPPGQVPGCAQRSGLLFVGSFDHLPNRDAVAWMVHEVLPLLHRRHPGTVLHVVGSNPSPDVLALASKTVEVHGWVRDVSVLARQCRVSVAPLRFGAGVKGKVGESVIAGLPTVCTPIAVEGMRLVDGEHVLVASTAAEFADQVAALLGDDELWQRLSEAGPAAVAEQFGPAAARRTLEELLDAAAKQASTG